MGHISNADHYNNYFQNNYREMKDSEMGLKFHLVLCIILSRWMFVLGKTAEPFRIPQKLGLRISAM